MWNAGTIDAHLAKKQDKFFILLQVFGRVFLFSDL